MNYVRLAFSSGVSGIILALFSKVPAYWKYQKCCHTNYSILKRRIQGQGLFSVLTHDSRGVAVHQFRLRSRWLHYTLFSDRYSVRCHTGTDQGHKEGSLCGDKRVFVIWYCSMGWM